MSCYILHITLFRPNGVGKILDDIKQSKFHQSYKQTIGVDILSKDVEFREGEIASLKIYDIAVKHRTEFLRKGVRSHGALIFFDLSNKESYEIAKKLYGEIKEASGSIPFILIGDKTHLVGIHKLVEDAHDFTKNEGGIYIELAPDDIDLLEETIITLTRRIFNNLSLEQKIKILF
jgi:GTPase SAR1 family protein